MTEGNGATGRRGWYEAAFAALNAAGIDVCLLRDELPRLDELPELDLLVARGDLRRAAEVLGYAGWELQDGGLFHPHKRALVAWAGDDFVKLDLHGEVIDGPFVYMDARWMMSGGARTDWNVLLPRREAWLLHVLLHTVLSKPALDPRFEERERACTAGPLDREAMLAQAARHGLREVAAALLEDPRAVREPARVAELERSARRRLLLRPRNALRWIRLRLAWSLGVLLGLRRGFLMAVVGPDGAGKTAFIEALREELERVHVPARTVYMGPWEPTRLPTSRLVAWLGANPLDELPGTGPDSPAWTRATKRAKGLVKRHLWYASTWLDVWARFLGHVLPRLLLRRVVLADRYLHDLEVGYYNQIVVNSPRLRRALVRLAPRPRLTLLLDHEPETIWARKREYTLAEIRGALRAYRRVARDHRLPVLRTDRAAQELARRFVAERWRDIARWRRDGPRWRVGRTKAGPDPASRSGARAARPELRGALRVEWIEDRAGLERIAPAWDRLVRASGADEPFLLSDFLLAWLTHFGAGRELCMLAVHAGGELVGGLPLYAEERRRTRMLLYPGAEDFAIANRTDFLAPRGFAQVVDAVLAALAAREDWEQLELTRLYLEPERFAGVERALERHGLLLMHAHRFPSYLIDVPPTLDHYLARRSKGFRRKLRQADERAASLGGLEFRDVRGKGAVGELFERFVELSRACYLARERRSTFEDERLCAFFRELVQRFERLGVLHAHELCVAGEPIAIGLGYSLHGNLNDVLTTFDARRAELMPGSLMTRAQLEHAIRLGAAVLDFSSGENPHKLRWADRREPVFGLLAARDTLRHRAEHRARAVARKVRGTG